MKKFATNMFVTKKVTELIKNKENLMPKCLLFLLFFRKISLLI